eukprot:scaffold634_cov66-Cyclotella_meneghiniana.AAC.2
MELQSLPCLIIHHTPNETLEQSSCCAVKWLHGFKITQSWCGNWDLMSKLLPLPLTQKPACSDHCDDGTPISTLSHHSSNS